MIKSGGNWFKLLGIGLPLALVTGSIVVAQIEGPKRGIAPIASTGDFEVTGVEVNVTGKDAFEARRKGWEEAQRLAWGSLWKRTHGSAGAMLSDSTLDGIVAAIVVEQEQVGPRRYVAKLGVLFDRARAGQLLGVAGVVRRSAPLLLLPVTYSAGAPTVFEQRTSWQRSWAKYRTADSTVDYVRPSGAGGESLLLNAGQMDRRSRIWWRTILDQFGAADVIIPIARIERQWPGGPVIGRFSARYGPDNKFLGAFSLRVPTSAGIPAMMDQAVIKMDQLFQSALADGRLRADASLVLEPEVIEEEDLETLDEEAPVEETGIPDLGAEAPSLDDVVRSIVPEAESDGGDQPNVPPALPKQVR
ncbi:MAG: heavy-metal-associated domain-containing protein [Sphingorhabdus sp.]